jgi:cytidylate kinase
MNKIIIAIDGYSSCGKSTIAKGLAKVLGYTFIDSGAMYRAVSLYFLENNIAFLPENRDEQAINKALDSIQILFVLNPTTGNQETFLNGTNVENEIRKLYVANHVSKVSTISAVRKSLVAKQQAMGNKKGIVMDGRDIGTVVFPNAELKLFVTADADIRAQRRQLELELKGETLALETIKQNLLERDFIDSTRADSPLKKAADAIEIDTSFLNPVQQLELALNHFKEKSASLQA